MILNYLSTLLSIVNKRISVIKFVAGQNNLFPVMPCVNCANVVGVVLGEPGRMGGGDGSELLTSVVIIDGITD
jgi:hypothetical protein